MEMIDNVDGLSINIDSGDVKAHIQLDDDNRFNVSNSNNTLPNIKNNVKNIKFSNYNITIIIFFIFTILILIIFIIYFYIKYLNKTSHNNIEANFKLDYRNKYSEFLK